MRTDRSTLLPALRGLALLVIMSWQVPLPGAESKPAAPKPAPPAPAALDTESWWRTSPKCITPVGSSRKVSASHGIVTRPAFNWQQIESTDYREYVQNLRAINCPEQTLRDIVSADVVQAYASKRSESLAARYRNFKFWQADPEAMAELARHRRAVDEATASTLIVLLGPDFVVPSFTVEWKSAELEQQLSFLPHDKRRQVQVVLMSYAETDAQIKQLADGHRRNEDTEELRRVMAEYDQKRAALTPLLTPEEYEQVELTCSWTAHNLRRAMTHFHPTEAEYRAIFRVWRVQDENLARLFAEGQPDPGNGHIFAKMKELLGEERYREYRATWWQ